MQILLKNAFYYTDNKFVNGNISVDGGKIVALNCTYDESTYEKVIDARGLVVLPGVVDCHVHFREPSNNKSEDFFTGSCAAAAGGVTLVCEMPNVIPPVYTAEILAHRIELAEAKSLVDIAFYGAAGFANRYNLQELLDGGVLGLKTFLHPAPSGREEDFYGLTVKDDGELFMLLREVAKSKARCVFHCENYQVIKQMESWLKEQGVTGYVFHYLSRPDVAEIQSVATVIEFAKATGAKVGVAHISVPEACALVKQAQQAGVDIIAETCFHYLNFDNSDIDRLGPYAKCNPPLRSRRDVDGLWDYVADGTISMIGSDHAPHAKEAKAITEEQPMWEAPSGLPSIEAMLPLMLQKVAEGCLTLERLAQLMSENACKNWGLYPQKGCIAVDSDADFTIVDTDVKYTLHKENMKTDAKDINLLFDGLQLQGKPVYTIVRGQVVMENGEVDKNKRGHGLFVARKQRITGCDE